MKEIIKPIDKEILKSELTKEKFLRDTNNGNKEIYIVTAKDSPNIMREIGRLREISFRDAGGGTGKDCDIDHYDTCENPYKQLIVWSPEDEEIVGGYRYIHGKDVILDYNGQPILATSKMFKFSEKFIKEYLPNTIELGRSFVQPNFQPVFDFRKGMYSLDNLWDGLGALILENPGLKYYFGKITMYTRFNLCARDLILYFLKKHFNDNLNLVVPYEPLELKTDPEKLKHTLYGESYKDDYKTLVQEVRNYKENIPPLVNAYMNLSSTMKYFGTAINYNFGKVEESGIMIAIDDIYDMKKERHLTSYKKKED